METNIKKVFIAALDDFEKCYIFAPSIGKKKNIGGKTYNVTRYFNGNRDFETSMKELATKQVNRNARCFYETEKVYCWIIFQTFPRG